MRSDGRWIALAAALALGGCSFEWDALRPGPDSGRATDTGRADAGAVDAGQVDTGVVDDVGEDAPESVDAPDAGQGSDVVDVPATDNGMIDAGTADTGPRDSGTIDAGTPDVGTADTGPRDTGTIDLGTPDTGLRDTGPVDVGTPDTGTTCSGPLCPCAPATPAGWCAVGATCVSGACAAGVVAGSLVITEIMNNPAAVDDDVGEWFEVYNTLATPVDLRGIRVRGNSTEMFEILSATPVLVPGTGYAVLALNGNSGVNGGVTAIYVYGAAMNLSNSADNVTLLGVDGTTVIDTVAYAASGWPETMGRSKSLRPTILDASMNNTAANWCAGGPSFGRGDFGTPGAANVCQ